MMVGMIFMCHFYDFSEGIFCQIIYIKDTII